MSGAQNAPSSLSRALDRLDRTPVEVAVGLAAAVLLVVNAFGPRVPGAAFIVLGLAFISPGGGLLAAAFTLFVLPPMRVGGPIFDLRPDEVLALGLVGGYGLRLLVGSARPRTRLWRAAVALVSIMAAWLVLRYGLRVQLPVLKAFYPTAKWGLRLALLGAVVWFGWRSDEKPRAIRVVLMIGALVAALTSIAQYFFPAVNEFVRSVYPAAKGEAARVFYYGRSFAAFEGNPNHLGAAMLLMSIVAFVWAERTKNAQVKIACAAAGLVFLAGMAHSGSRGAFIVLGILSVGYVLRRHWLALAGTGFAVIYTVLVPNALRARLPLLFTVHEGTVQLGTSTTGKVAMLDPSYAVSRGTIVTPVDSTYLDFLYNYGPIALVAFFALLFLVAAYVTRGSMRDDHGGSATAAVWVLAAMVLLALNGPFFSVSRVAELSWIIVGLGIAAAVRSRERLFDRSRIGVCTSVHTAVDSRIMHREALALSSRFNVRLYVCAGVESGPDRVGAVSISYVCRAPRNRFVRALRAPVLVQRALADGAAAVMVHDPEMLPWLVTLGREPDVVTVYDMHEDYVTMVRSKPWIPAWLRGTVGFLLAVGERVFLPNVDLLVVADEYLASEYEARKPVLVRNYPPRALFSPGIAAGERAPIVVYIGGVTHDRGASVMAAALGLVRERIPDAELHVVGRVPHGDAGELLRSIAGVSIVGEVGYDEIGRYVRSARVGLALLQDTPKYRHNVPSKVFDYMACGTPYVASDFDNIHEATGDVGGLFVTPDDARAVADAMIRLLTDDALATRLGAEGVAAAAGRFAFEAEGERLADRLEELLETRTSLPEGLA